MPETFFNVIRQKFDPCFRYIVLIRRAAEENARAFSDIKELLDSSGLAVVCRSFHRDRASGMVALVLKCRPDIPASPLADFFGNNLPEDIVLYIYEPRKPAGNQPTGKPSPKEGCHRP
ncbi:MAG: hypothetical protein PVG78_17295 [Desulfobacterales bacterium]|jgi:hypothetical protein